MENNPNLIIPDCCEIRPSPIHGVGVFAKTLIPANTAIIQYTGTEMSYQEFKQRYGNDWRYTYRRMPWLPVIVSKDNRNLINYINDGIWGQAKGVCNVYLKKGWLYSYENIEAGQELLLDYGKRYWMHHFFPEEAASATC